MKNQLPQIAIVGRANVGKSTLFNRLISKDKALTSPIAGTTRDRNIDIAKWRDREFTVVDTGGLDIDKHSANDIEKNIVVQAQKGIESANLILFVIDIKNGIIPADKELAKLIVKKNLKAKTILVCNKADSIRLRQINQEIFKLNLGEPQMISAVNGSGVGDLLDYVLEKLPAKKELPEEKKDIIKIAIVGKPNVGKSSLINSILGEERVIVSDIAHTTREAHDIAFSYQDKNYVLIDTAGIRKQNKIIYRSLERAAVDRSLKAIEEADVVILVTEAQKTIDAQDKKITQEILESSKPLIIAANKWDLIDNKDTNTINEFVEYYRAHFPYLWWAPIIFISAKENLRTKKIFEVIQEVNDAKKIQLSDSQLDKFLKTSIKQHRPSRGKGLKNPYIYKIRQIGTNPPRFCIFVNDPTVLHFSYIRFLQNHLREKFKILGTPIQIETQKWNRELEKKQAK